MTVTSIEQAKNLIDAGLAQDTADMYWVSRRRLQIELLPNNNPNLEKESTISPAWSLAALWDIVHNLDKTYEFDTTMSAQELLNFLVHTICYRFNER